MDLDLNHFTERNKEKDIIELTGIIQSELYQLKRLRITEDNSYDVERYKEHIHDLVFFLQNRIIPGNTGIAGLKIFMPIIYNLIEKKQIDKSYLSMLE